jgi:4-hydroxy-tetrahydrodipicolinate synthase
MSSPVIERLRRGLIPAVPVPFGVSGEIDDRSQERYTAWMNGQPITGVAVWAHTGRGLYLSHEQRERVLRTWREATPDKLVIAGAGGSREAQSDEDYMASAKQMAEHAASFGADALLCYAPARFRDRSQAERDELILQYHEQLAFAGLPLILFYLYEAAGGISYSQAVLTSLLQMPQVIGIKIATLDSVMTYQDISRLCRYVAPEKLVITGEDRFLGYSLMCGADAALIGMGAAYTQVQADLLSSYFTKDFTRFDRLSEKADRLAQATFVAPMEGYISRMSYILSRHGIFDRDSWKDPWGPALTNSEQSAIDDVMSELDHALP